VEIAEEWVERNCPEFKMTWSQVRRWNAVVDHELCAVLAGLVAWVLAGRRVMWAMSHVSMGTARHQFSLGFNRSRRAATRTVRSNREHRHGKQRQGHATEQLTHAFMLRVGQRVRQLTPDR
jgi:hypothetical protein